MSKIVYVTGCLGFIGHHVTRACLARGWHVIGVDRGTYAANFDVLGEFVSHPNFLWHPGDINDLPRLHDCDYVINTAAETHVDNSIVGSDIFLKSNVNGVHRILELIREFPQHRRPVMLHFSTDEVYGDIEQGSHTESDILRPSNPYSASKAAADLLVLAWARTYGIRYVIVRPTNNYGIGQYVEKLIPKSIKFLNLSRKVDLHDNGLPKRTWLHVTDTVQAVMTLIDTGTTNEIFNISGNIELANHVVLEKIIGFMFGSQVDLAWQNYIVNCTRAGQDVRYSIDDTKLKNLGWQARADFDQELEKIVAHYRNNFVW